MPRYFFDVTKRPPAFDPAGFACDDDTDAIIQAEVFAISISLCRPGEDPERRVAIINDRGREIGNVPVYFKPSHKHPDR